MSRCPADLTLTNTCLSMRDIFAYSRHNGGHNEPPALATPRGLLHDQVRLSPIRAADPGEVATKLHSMCLESTRWPVEVRAAADVISFVGVKESSCSLHCDLLRNFLLGGALGLDMFDGFNEWEAAQLGCLVSGSRGFISGDPDLAVGVGESGSHPVAAYLVGPVFVDEQCLAFLLVPLVGRRLCSLGCLELLGGVNHLGIVLGTSRCLFGRPCRQLLGFAGQSTPSIAHP